jgi:hypothetical protein
VDRVDFKEFFIGGTAERRSFYEFKVVVVFQPGLRREGGEVVGIGEGGSMRSSEDGYMQQCFGVT